MSEDIRPGEIAIPLPETFDAGVYFIGRIRTPWQQRSECPKNARGSDAECTLEVDPRYAAGLDGVAGCSHVVVLYFMHQARRDLMVQAPPKLNGAGVTAINVGARLGVAGVPIAVPAYRGERFAMLKALADMNVSLTDGTGARLGGGKGSDILDHPLNAVVWLAGALAQEGLAMQPGDLISLGSFSALLPPKAGLSVTATYDGLPGAAPVQLSFK